MLSFAHVHADLWFLAFFALVPFLWRLSTVGRREAPSLGMILATTYVLTTCFGDFVAAPWMVLVKLLSLNFAFAVFSYAISRLRVLLGFNPLAIAVLWVPFGFALTQYAGIGEIFFVEQVGANLIAGFGSLVGLLLCSAVVVLGNSLLLLFVRYAYKRLLVGGRFKLVSDFRFHRPSPATLLFETRRYTLPSRRAPPMHTL
jgi:hypothetical protein